MGKVSAKREAEQANAAREASGTSTDFSGGEQGEPVELTEEEQAEAAKKELIDDLHDIRKQIEGCAVSGDMAKLLKLADRLAAKIYFLETGEQVEDAVVDGQLPPGDAPAG